LRTFLGPEKWARSASRSPGEFPLMTTRTTPPTPPRPPETTAERRPSPRRRHRGRHGDRDRAQGTATSPTPVHDHGPALPDVRDGLKPSQRASCRNERPQPPPGKKHLNAPRSAQHLATITRTASRSSTHHGRHGPEVAHA
jgi:hypothetical protein